MNFDEMIQHDLVNTFVNENEFGKKLKFDNDCIIGNTQEILSTSAFDKSRMLPITKIQLRAAKSEFKNTLPKTGGAYFIDDVLYTVTEMEDEEGLLIISAETMPSFEFSQSCQVNEFIKTTSNGPLYSEYGSVQCFIKPQVKLVVNEKGQEVATSGFIAFPAKTRFKVGSRIIFEENEFELITLEPKYTYTTESHVEGWFR